MRILRPSLRLRALLALAALAGLAALRGPALLILPAALALLNLLFEPAAARQFLRPRFWIFALAPPAIASVFLGPRDLPLAFLRLSRQGLQAGLAMSARAVCLLLIFQLALGALSVSRLIRLLHYRGFRGLGFALGVAHNMLATLSETSGTVLHTLRLRGALRRHPFQSLRWFLVAVVSATLRHGEDIVHAACARGFDAR
mgnify:CR=1 FL=1